MLDKKQLMTKPLAIFFVAVICTLLWGSAFPALKISYAEMSIAHDIYAQIFFAGTRFFLAGLIILFFLAVSGQSVSFPRVDLKDLVVLSLFLTTFQYLFFYLGIAHTTGIKSSILMSTSSFFAVGLSALFYREDRMSSRKIAGVTLGFIGIIVLNLTKGTLETGFTIRGDLFLIFSCFSSAIANLLVKGFQTKINIVLVTGWQMIIGSLFLLLIGLSQVHLGDINLSLKAILIFIYLGFLSAVAFSLWNMLIKYNNISRITVFNFLIPVFGSVLSAIFIPGEVIGMYSLFGLIFVSLGIFVMNCNLINKIKETIS